MPGKTKPPKLTKAWKIRILQEEIDSSDFTLESWDIYNSASDQEENEMVIATKNEVERWMNELKGISQPKLSMDDLDWRIHILDNDIDAMSQIQKYEETLTNDNRTGFKEDIKKLKVWEAELREQKKKLW